MSRTIPDFSEEEIKQAYQLLGIKEDGEMPRGSSGLVSTWNNIQDEVARDNFYYYGDQTQRRRGAPTPTMFHCLCPIFWHRLKNRQRIPFREYRYLFLPVGFSSQPLLYSILALQPESVIPIVGDPATAMEVEKQVRRAYEKWLKPRGATPVAFLNPPLQVGLLDSPLLAFEVFRVIRDKWLEIRKTATVDPRAVAIDISGGKKSMVAGAFEAASVYGFDLYYVDYERYDINSRRPHPGTEFLTRLDNPYEVFSVREWLEICTAFDTGHYPEVSARIDHINKTRDLRYIDQALQQDLQDLGNWAQAYVFWDEYRYSDAQEVLSGSSPTVLQELARFDNLSNQIRPSPSDIPSLSDRLIEVQKGQISQHPELLFLYLLDKYANALRKGERGDFQGGFIRLINLLELLTNFLLYQTRHSIKEKHGAPVDFWKWNLFGRSKILQRGQSTIRDYRCNEYFISLDKPMPDYPKFQLEINLRNNLAIIHSQEVITFEGYRQLQVKIFNVLQFIHRQYFDEVDLEGILQQLEFKKSTDLLSRQSSP